MSEFPDTQASLIARLSKSPAAGDSEDPTRDEQAWAEFATIYEPFVYSYAIRRGLQDSDARELVQTVMISVARSVGRWRPGDGQPRFRNWLFTIARNHLINLVKTSRNHQAKGGSSQWQLLNAHVESGRSSESDAAFWDREYRRDVFLWAASRVRNRVSERTWDAFWRTSVQGHACDVVASELGMTPGNLYACRSRVLSRIKNEVTTLNEYASHEKLKSQDLPRGHSAAQPEPIAHPSNPTKKESQR